MLKSFERMHSTFASRRAVPRCCTGSLSSCCLMWRHSCRIKYVYHNVCPHHRSPVATVREADKDGDGKADDEEVCFHFLVLILICASFLPHPALLYCPHSAAAAALNLCVPSCDVGSFLPQDDDNDGIKDVKVHVAHMPLRSDRSPCW